MLAGMRRKAVMKKDKRIIKLKLIRLMQIGMFSFAITCFIASTHQLTAEIKFQLINDQYIRADRIGYVTPESE